MREEQTKTDTPITDAEEARQYALYESGWPSFAVDFEFARKLERENAQLRQPQKLYPELNYIDQDIINHWRS
jgi:hypothetical protein